MATTNATTNLVSQPVTFTTQTQYPLPTQKFMIPAAWKRYQLSQLVNKALSLDKPVPFDFLIKGELLRTTLAEWCAENGVGEEETLQIEYIESVMPPQKMSDFPHEDWVSSVVCKIPGYFLTASYDGQIRAFDYSQNLLLSTAVHPSPITSICVVSSSPYSEGDSTTYTIASASHDLTAQLTSITLENSPSSSSKSCSTSLASLHLHTGPISSISSSSNGVQLLTSSWDGLIGCWDASIPTSDEVPESANHPQKTKRRKVESGDKPKRKAPLQVLKSHTARVSKVVFGRLGGEAMSCGFDSTVRLWDLESGICKYTVSASEKPFLDLCLAPSHSESSSLVLATSTDRTMTLYDLRSSGLTSAAASFSHPAAPSCVSASASAETPQKSGSIGDNNNTQQVVTGSYDGIVRLWDLRSTKGALASFKAFEGGKKILSVDWARGLVGVGGEGGLAVWKVGEGERV